MKMLAPHDGPDISPVDSSGEWHTATVWMVLMGCVGVVVVMIAAFACWLARRRNSLAHKLGKRGPDKALVFQPPRRATAVRSPGSATHYLRKSPSPTAPQPPTAGSPPQPQPPPLNPFPHQGSGHVSPHSPTAPTEPTPLSKELADANATEKIKPVEPENNDGRLGDLHFRLRYENEKNALVVSVVSCQGLPGREPAGPDPYVKLQLLPDKQHKVKTRVVRKTRCPVYDEDFTFYGLAPHQLTGITLHFVVLSFDRYSRDEIIGEVVAPLTNLQLQIGDAMALCREIQPRSLKMRSVGRGEVLVSLCWQPAAARLTVVLLKARNLPKMDVTGLADPYVKMYLLYNGQRIAKKKTHVKKRTLNPVFNESFVFEVPAAPNATLDHVSLELLVLDWDRVTKNEVIGRLELGAEGAGSARHHWREVQAAPRRQIADWHKLKE
ncbi:synaptotagmin-4 isoform X2 [Plodia interpunctella]|uniref:synaptotagmin-4 isoform X2 n=1 Tax=Plodia interpunctella TaxID=58824 RepID=UPI0023686B00|nr:synaptotagmin-4 isoform X2 [Plodia interpunctella]